MTTTIARTTTTWTIDAVRALGTTTDVQTAGAILGIGRTKAYELAKVGTFPVAILRVGRRYLVPVLPLLDALGANGHSAEAQSSAGQPSW